MAFGQPRIQYVEGRCAGGGSEINSGLYYRLPEDVRQRWASRWQINDFTRQELEDLAAQKQFGNYMSMDCSIGSRHYLITSIHEKKEDRFIIIEKSCIILCNDDSPMFWKSAQIAFFTQFN